MKLNDRQINDRLIAASAALSADAGETVRGNTAIEAARRALLLLQLGLVHAIEHSDDHIPTVIAPQTDAPVPQARRSWLGRWRSARLPDAGQPHA